MLERLTREPRNRADFSRTKANRATWLFVRFVVIKVDFRILSLPRAVWHWNSSRYMASIKNESKSELYLEEYLRSGHAALGATSGSGFCRK
jgi:hypothetical protein